MKCKRFSIEQITTALQQQEMGIPVREIWRKLGISEATLYCWKKVYGVLQPDQVRELKPLIDDPGRR